MRRWNHKLEMIGMEPAVAESRLMSQNFPEGTEENHRIPPSGYKCPP
jgi:hypothetical protein